MPTHRRNRQLRVSSNKLPGLDCQISSEQIRDDEQALRYASRNRSRNVTSKWNVTPGARNDSNPGRPNSRKKLQAFSRNSHK
ncbi:hypothetical protein BGLA2_980002 [Burkholderia gladioli]|nr:hypothetical protein BGLA2_980002 [Burkholderia gladioli]